MSAAAAPSESAPHDVGDRIATVMVIDEQAPAVYSGGSWWSWGDLSAHGTRIDAVLPEQLRTPGLRVAMVMRNRPPHVAAILGSLVRHRCIVPISSIQQPGRLARDVATQRAHVVLADAQDWAHAELREAVAESGAFGIGFDGHQVTPVVGSDQRDPPTPTDDTAILLPTSGTTGPPKRVPVTYRDLAIGFDRVRRYARGNAKAATAPRLSKGVALSCTPLVHIAGLWEVLQFAVEGRRLAMLDRFEPHAWAALVAEHQPVVTMLPPPALVMLLDAGIEPTMLTSLRAIMCGTAPLAPDIEERFTDHFGVPVLTTYGATEFPGGLVGWTLDDKRAKGTQKRGSVGRGRPGVEIRVVGADDGAPVAPGQEGLIEARTPQTVARGVDGWVRTTDLGRLDDEGFLWVTGRADGAINRGGFTILPEAIESVLTAHPAIRSAGAVGIPDARLGEVPVAAVELRAPADEEELTAWARDRLLTYQVPARIAIVDELPKTPSMKVSRPALRELLEAQNLGTNAEE